MKVKQLFISLLVVLVSCTFSTSCISCSNNGNDTEIVTNDTKALQEALMKIAKENPDGFTVDATTLKPVTKGFAVSVEATQNSFGEEGLAKVITYVKSHPEVNAYGGWLNSDNNKYYFDATMICQTKEEAEKMAKENHQTAYYDLEKNEEIRP